MKLPPLLTAIAVLVPAFVELHAASVPNNTDRSSTALLQAKPEPVALDLTKMAVLVVDMQNDFGSKGGLFDLMGFDLAAIQKVVPSIANVVASARKRGAKIIYLKMGFFPDLSNAGLPDSPNRIGHLRVGAGRTVRAPDGRESRVLIRDTWNTDILDELKPAPEDIVIYKHRYSGFYQTELDAVLRKLGVRQLIVTGCTTSVCVESTVRDAMFHDYNCIVLADCTAEPQGADFPRSNHEATLFMIQRAFGSVSTSADFIETLETKVGVPIRVHAVETFHK